MLSTFSHTNRDQTRRPGTKLSVWLYILELPATRFSIASQLAFSNNFPCKIHFIKSHKSSNLGPLPTYRNDSSKFWKRENFPWRPADVWPPTLYPTQWIYCSQPCNLHDPSNRRVYKICNETSIIWFSMIHQEIILWGEFQKLKNLGASQYCLYAIHI